MAIIAAQLNQPAKRKTPVGTRIPEFRLSQNLKSCQFGQASQSNQRNVPYVSINPEKAFGVNARVCRSHVP